MASPAVFFDKDGTLVNDDGFPRVIPTDKIYLESTVTGMRALQEAGHKLIIISNQGWISTGRLSIPEADDVFKSVTAQYAERGVRIDGYYFCPHGKTDGCACRKPLPGMLERAAAEHGIVREGSCFVGDLETDVLAGKAFGIATCIVRNGKDYAGTARPDYLVEDVDSFAQRFLEDRVRR